MKLCKPVPVTSKAMLLPFLRTHFLTRQPPLDVLTTSLESRPGEGVDVLALTPEGRLVAVMAHLDKPAGLIDELFARLHWMIENASLIQRFFPTVEVDVTQRPRLVLVMPRLDDRTRDLLGYFTATELEVHEFRMVEMDGEVALLMEQVAGYPVTEDTRATTVSVPAPPPPEEAEAALDQVVARREAPPTPSLTEDSNVEIHVDDINVAELGVSEEELLDLLNIQVPDRDPNASAH